MYNTQSYYHSLGTAGHRGTSSYNYVPVNGCGYVNQENVHNPGFMYGPYNTQPNGPQYLGAPVGSLSSIPMGLGQSLQTHGGIPARGAIPPPMISDMPPLYQEQQTGAGANSVLEYDLQNMSSFLSWCCFGMLKQRKNPGKDFEGLVSSILYATRLSTSTIIIALEYMNQRFSTCNFGELPELTIFLKLVVSLVLGNKFNDDNTFTNRSWCGATGLSIGSINREEKEWLEEIKWQLNVVKFESNIKTLEECWRTWLEKYSAKLTRSSPVTPHSFHSPFASTLPSYSPSSSSSPLYEKGVNGYNYNTNYGSSPANYFGDSIWSNPRSNQVWSYANSYRYDHGNNLFTDPGSQHMGSSNFVGYTNPYYNYNMASC